MRFSDVIKKTKRKFTVAYILLNNGEQKEYLTVYPFAKDYKYYNRYSYLCYYRKEKRNGEKQIYDDKPQIISEVILRNMIVADYH